MAFTLTERQAEAKAFIVDYIARNGNAPSYNEIADALGLSSKSGVHRLMQGLIDRGHIRTIPNSARAIEVIA